MIIPPNRVTHREQIKINESIRAAYLYRQSLKNKNKDGAKHEN